MVELNGLRHGRPFGGVWVTSVPLCIRESVALSHHDCLMRRDVVIISQFFKSVSPV